MNILYFFIGTEAELMKMFSVINLAAQEGFACRIISSGQNIINDSPFLKLAGRGVDIDLSEYASTRKTSGGYLRWFIQTQHYGTRVMKREMREHAGDKCLMIVHGDTLSTWMGARIARKINMDYVHVESGPRSHRWLSPFPEEIDRFLASLHAGINFCPKDSYAEYAGRRFRGRAVSTVYNTGIETLYYALTENEKKHLKRPVEEKYFILALHRQENLLSRKFMERAVQEAAELADRMRCVFIYHEQTRDALDKYGLWNLIENHPGIDAVGRLPYCEFIHYVCCSEFVAADGCGNQQEFYYLGKPYLILRTKVEEDSEGLGWNAECFYGDFGRIRKFSREYHRYEKPRIEPEVMPSRIIVRELKKYFRKQMGR